MAATQIHPQPLGTVRGTRKILDARDITVRHGRQITLASVSIAVKPGELTALIGPSGAGKTTLLKTLSFLERPQAGSIILDDQTYQFSEKGSAPENHSSYQKPWPRVTTVFQQLFLWPHLTLRRNITLALGKNISAEQHEYLNYLVDKLQIATCIDRYPNQASVGQKQRAALVRALILKPQYLLLDEITSSLDVEQISLILSEINELKKQGLGILLITHLLQFARKTADCVVFLDQGKILEAGDQVLFNPQHERVRRFLSSAEIAY